MKLPSLLSHINSLMSAEVHALSHMQLGLLLGAISSDLTLAMEIYQIAQEAIQGLQGAQNVQQVAQDLTKTVSEVQTAIQGPSQATPPAPVNPFSQGPQK